MIRTVYLQAKVGAQNNVANAGIFNLDTDSNGRWSVEKFKGLIYQIERDANAIAQQTRRGKGNFILCSADVASALNMAGVLDYTPALSTNGLPDDTGNTFVGTLNGGVKVYVDPYSANLANDHYYVAGYKGSSAYDAGLFYCPYVPLQMVRAVDQGSFQPKIEASRPATVWSPTPSCSRQMVPLWAKTSTAPLARDATSTTVACWSATLCDPSSHIPQGVLRDPFFYVNFLLSSLCSDVSIE